MMSDLGNSKGVDRNGLFTYSHGVSFVLIRPSITKQHPLGLMVVFLFDNGLTRRLAQGTCPLRSTRVPHSTMRHPSYTVRYIL